MPRQFPRFLAVSGLGLMATLMSTAAQADVPSVATDITPVHSLVSIVMGDLGTPSLIVRPGASPHGYAMRPSEAQALNGADLVVWMGEALTPWLEGPIENLAGGAHKIELMSVEGTILHDYREGATFAAHDHDHG
ncbi:MAG: metal ABC transporter solute-binding protein, Zn/Mn family, partial [Roseinatronobacter sp.]